MSIVDLYATLMISIIVSQRSSIINCAKNYLLNLNYYCFNAILLSFKARRGGGGVEE